MLIKNRKELQKNSKLRSIILDALENALSAASPENLMKGIAKSIDSSRYENIYLIGAGKAGAGMALSAEKLFRIKEGVICVPEGTEAHSGKIEFVQAGHPFPNDGSIQGALKILDLSKKVNENDLTLCLLSGGGSALMCLPSEGISLEEKMAVSKHIMEAGADIAELNTVRKHLSQIKGGWLANKFSHCTLRTVVISDVVGDRLDVIASGPTVPDMTTFSDTKRILEKYRAWEKFSNVKALVLKGISGSISETPKPGSPAFEKSRIKIIANNTLGIKVASETLKKRGIEHVVIENVTGEARDVGVALSHKLAEGKSFVAGGETTVKVKGKGIGGRNQELALSCALKIKGTDAVLASMGTDGIDGNSHAAGALVDGKTAESNAQKFLQNNDSNSYLLSKGDAIFTGLTGTNINDLIIGISKK